MSGDTGLLITPISTILEARDSHSLRYRNNPNFDYTYADFMLIPHAINVWAEQGIDLSSDFVDRCWRDFANRQLGQETGERLRTEKLLLDALKSIYDASAFASYTKCQALYRPSDDSAGRDLKVLVPDVGPVWLQMRVMVNGDWRPVKEMRQERRGQVAGDPWDAVACESDLDKSAQPWLPRPAWYRQQVEAIRLTHRTTAADRCA